MRSGYIDKPVCKSGRCVSLGTLTQAIRNFAKSLEGWLTNAMTNFPQEIVRTKVTRKKTPILFIISLILCGHIISIDCMKVHV